MEEGHYGHGRGGGVALHVLMGLKGEPPFSYGNRVWRVDLGAHLKLEALVRALLELSFFGWTSIFSYGAQVRTLLKLF